MSQEVVKVAGGSVSNVVSSRALSSLNFCDRGNVVVCSVNYCAMHFSAKRGLAIACRPSVCLSSVCL